MRISKREEFNQLDAVATEVSKEVTSTSGKLAALVATHEHADHVGAFEPGKATLKTLSEIPVDEVWTAWTEGPDDEIAKVLHGHLAAQAHAAVAALPKLSELVKLREGMPQNRFAARVCNSHDQVSDILANFGVTDAVPLDPSPAGEPWFRLRRRTDGGADRHNHSCGFQ